MASTSDLNPAASLRYSAVIAGFGLLAMAILGGVAIIGGLDQLIDQSSATQTFANLSSEPDVFRFATLSVLAVAILDVIVALALWAYFKPAAPKLAVMTAGVRIMYAAIFLVAIAQLFDVWPSLAAEGTNPAAEQFVFDEAMRFYAIWDVGLGVFGVHLVLLGSLVFFTPYTPKWIGVLLFIAGLGYVIDTLDAVLLAGSIPEVSTVTFVGEVVFLLWLLIRGHSVRLIN